MKKSSTLLFLFIAVATLFTSCSEQLTLTKRHYKSGYYVDFSSNKHVESNVIANSTNTNEKQNVSTNVPTITNNDTKAVAQVQNQISIVKNAPVTNRAIAKKHVVKETSDKTLPFTKTAAELTENKTSELAVDAADNLAQANSTSDHVVIVSGLSLILIVIITIFIPPLGVALVYGLDLHFWIDLILTLLFFIPGLIYGLVVVLM